MRNFDTTNGVYWRVGPIYIEPRENGEVFVEYTEREAAVVAGKVRYLDGQPIQRTFVLTKEDFPTATAPLVDPTTGQAIGGNATATGLYLQLLAFVRKHQSTFE